MTRLPVRPAFATEEAFQQSVIDAAKTLRCLVYHTRDSRRSVKGFPDLVIVGRRGVLYRELKLDTTQVTEEQQQWLSRLALAGQNAAVWRPNDWPHHIFEELRAVASR